MNDKNYIHLNRESWNRRVDVHLASKFYDQQRFLSGKSSLKKIELDLLGDVSGKKILHLQCHFGQDSLSLSRMGASVTGVDLSDKAIDVAQQLARDTNQDARFICCDIYDLPQHLDEQFDIVFTSYGVVGWLPDLDVWAKVISRFLKPGARLVFVEFHPVIWMFDDTFEKVGYNYFNDGDIVETESGTYADRDAAISGEYVMWNHALSEVISSLINQGLQIENFDEYDFSPYNCFQKTVEVAEDQFRIAHLENRIPMVYSVIARKV